MGAEGDKQKCEQEIYLVLKYSWCLTCPIFRLRRRWATTWTRRWWSTTATRGWFLVAPSSRVTTRTLLPSPFFAPLLHFFYTTASHFFPSPPMRRSFFQAMGKEIGCERTCQWWPRHPSPPYTYLQAFVPTLCPHLACAELQKCTHAAPNVLELATRGKPELSHPLQWFSAILTSQLYANWKSTEKNTFCSGGGPGINAAVVILWVCRWNEKGR